MRNKKIMVRNPNTRNLNYSTDKIFWRRLAIIFIILTIIFVFLLSVVSNHYNELKKEENKIEICNLNLDNNLMKCAYYSDISEIDLVDNQLNNIAYKWEN